MSQFYTDPTRETDEHALPDAETVYFSAGEFVFDDESDCDPGWYWWPCFPGCLPDGDPIGPFETEEEAIEDAREGAC